MKKKRVFFLITKLKSPEEFLDPEELNRENK